MRRSLSILLLLSALAGSSPAQTNHNISVQAFSFAPTAITVNVGDTVTWTVASGFHTVTSGAGSAPAQRPGAMFDVQVDPFGTTTFVYRVTSCGENGNGVIPYFCRVHEFFGMAGRINVRPILSSTGAPRIGTNVNLALNVAFQPGRLYAMAAAVTSTPGIDVGGGRIWAVTPDSLFVLSIGVNAPPFVGFGGGLNMFGQATGQLQLPNMALLVGLPLNIAYLTIDPGVPGFIGAVSNTISFTVQP